MVIIVTDIVVYIAIIVAIIVRLVLMKGSFTLPTFYRRGNEMSFNLGSVFTIAIALISAFYLMHTSPQLFANPAVTFVTCYTSPQIVDAVITSGARNFMKVEDETDKDKTDEEVA